MGNCGLCGAPALVLWWLSEWQLERPLCGHCSNDRERVMSKAGWVIAKDTRVDGMRPGLGPVTSDPMTH